MIPVLHNLSLQHPHLNKEQLNHKPKGNLRHNLNPKHNLKHKGSQPPLFLGEYWVACLPLVKVQEKACSPCLVPPVLLKHQQLVQVQICLHPHGLQNPKNLQRVYSLFLMMLCHFLSKLSVHQQFKSHQLPLYSKILPKFQLFPLVMLQQQQLTVEYQVKCILAHPLILL